MRCVNSPSLRFSGVKELEGPLLHPRARANWYRYTVEGGADCAQSPYSFESEHEKLRPILLGSRQARSWPRAHEPNQLRPASRDRQPK